MCGWTREASTRDEWAVGRGTRCTCRQDSGRASCPVLGRIPGSPARRVAAAGWETRRAIDPGRAAGWEMRVRDRPDRGAGSGLRLAATGGQVPKFGMDLFTPTCNYVIVDQAAAVNSTAANASGALPARATRVEPAGV